LLVIGALFSGLAAALFLLVPGEDLAYLFPVVVFGGVGLISLLIGSIGNDRAVAKIWKAEK